MGEVAHLRAQHPALACSFLSTHSPSIFCVPVSLLRVEDRHCALCIIVKSRGGQVIEIYMPFEKV